MTVNCVKSQRLDLTTSFRCQLVSSSLLDRNYPFVFKLTMTFGFGVGDVIKALELANEIRARFVDAPAQFEAISDE